MNKYILVIIIVIIFFYFFLKIKKIKKDNRGIPDVKWPFINLKDQDGKNINMLGVKAYLETDENKEKFLEYIDKGIKFIGCSSYLKYPSRCTNQHGNCHVNDYKINDKYIEEYVYGWCHCFKEPEKYIKSDIPKILISESDFNAENLEYKENIDIKYDYITVQPKDNNCKDGWHSHNKNWPLAEKCIEIFSDEFGLKGLIVGRGDCPINIKNKQNIETTESLDYFDFIDKIRESRFMLLPNFEDPSPRVLTEALTLNKPVFVNENILGGWKYVNDKTGMFFNENNIRTNLIEFLQKINTNMFSPREYYLNNHGIKHSGKELHDFLKKINPELCECELVRFDYA